ncbi:MAG TPA: GNAT family N-acetyltransferase [Microscillaceae bacterium]|nr:GNAT family N-acetyltransferase [Microscillaceae bacterium]
MNIRYQQAILGDITHLLPLVEAFYALENIPFDSKATSEALEEFIQNPNWGYLWLIRTHEKLIGYLIVALGYSLEFKGRDAFVDEIFIVKDYRGQGIGSKVLDFVANHCQAQGIKAFHLEVARSNEVAQRTYEKLGFEKRTNYFLMTKDLG